MPLFARKPAPRTDRQRRARRRKTQQWRESVKRVGVPPLIIEAVSTLPRLRDASQQLLYGVAWLAWVSDERARQHKSAPDAFWVHHEELNALFGQSRFSAVNSQFSILAIAGGAKPGEARAYRLESDIDEVVTAALRAANQAVDRTVVLLPDDWHLAVRARPAIERDSLSDSSIWRATRIGLPVPVPGLDLLAALDDWLARADAAGMCAREGLLREVQVEPHAALTHLRQYLERFRWRLHSELPGRGYYTSTYRQTDTGRLQEVGYGLQGAQRVIKHVALHGFWSYDMSAAHISILRYLAATVGVAAEAAIDYSEHKVDRRREVHERTGVPRDIVKRGFTAMGYGSRQWDGDEDDDGDSITTELVRRYGELKGRDLAAAFWTDSYVKYFSNNYARVGHMVVKALSRGRWLRNAAGLVYNVRKRKEHGKKKDTWATRLAFILQGLEARALHAVVTAYPNEMLVLEHDGWTSRSPMNMEAVERVIEKALGFPLQLKSERISAPAILLHRTIKGSNAEAA